MAFQTTIQFRYTEGFVGEIIADGPVRARTWRLNSQIVLPNTVGFAYTFVSDATGPINSGNQGTGIVVVGNTGVFAGIAVMPKTLTLNGTAAGGSLAPSYNMLPDTKCELLDMGKIVVNLTTAANTYGLGVYYVTATGALGAGTAAAGQVQIPNAKVISNTTQAGRAVIQLTQ